MKPNKYIRWLIVISVVLTYSLLLHKPVEALANANANSKASVTIIWSDDDITKPINPEGSSEPEGETGSSDTDKPITDSSETSDSSSGNPSDIHGGGTPGDGDNSYTSGNGKQSGTNRLPQTGEELLAYAGIIGVLLVLGGLVIRQVKKNKQQL